jgi:BirA family biotin operon repressor/biotin-[acetyl-CoA-carboxylase] ligase
MGHELSPTTFKILDILNDCQTHTGTEIAEHLHISRNAVWKAIQRLKKHHVVIHSRHGGYVLETPLVLLDKNKIKNLVEEPGISVACFETVTSTNDVLKDAPFSDAPQICLAEYQSKGRGRMGRPWASYFGRNIHCSFSYTFEKDISELSGLSLAIAILTAKALNSFNQNLHPFLKWPNDIYLNNQKAGGILIDINAEAHGKCTAIIGVGLNVNMKGLELQGIDQPWTSLEYALNRQVDRNLVIVHLINTLLKGMRIFAENGMKPFLANWKRYDFLENKAISVIQGSTHISGIARGITSQGHLRLELPSGDIQTFSYGDTSIPAP